MTPLRSASAVHRRLFPADNVLTPHPPSGGFFRGEGMRIRTPLALAGLVLAVGVLQPAYAEVTASGTRLAVGDGQPRSYMTYGTLAGGELYAPIIGPLFRLGVTFNRQDAQVEVFVRGKSAAKWPVVTSRDRKAHV